MPLPVHNFVFHSLPILSRLLTNFTIMSFIVLTNFSLPFFLNMRHRIATSIHRYEVLFLCLCITCNFLFSFPSSQHPVHLPESHHILRESRGAEAKITCRITFQTTRHEIYCKFRNKHQYFYISSLGRPYESDDK